MSRPRITPIALACLLVLCMAGAALAALLKCPDCGSMVSPKAAACPKCGCPADTIRRANPAQAPGGVNALQAGVVEVRTDVGSTAGAVVRQGETNYLVVLPLPIEGANTISLRDPAGGDPIVYATVEAAEDRALLRFTLADASLPARSLAESAVKPGDRWTLYPTDGTRTRTSRGEVVTAGSNSCQIACPSELKGREVGVATDAASNLLAFAYVPEGSISGAPTISAVIVSPDIRWIPVECVDLSEQMGILHEARRLHREALRAGGKVPKNTGYILTSLGQTQWLTPHLKSEADSLRNALSGGK